MIMSGCPGSSRAPNTRAIEIERRSREASLAQTPALAVHVFHIEGSQPSHLSRTILPQDQDCDLTRRRESLRAFAVFPFISQFFHLLLRGDVNRASILTRLDVFTSAGEPILPKTPEFSANAGVCLAVEQSWSFSENSD